MTKTFLVDVDGVLLHWSTGFNFYVLHVMGYKPETTIEQFVYIDEWLGISHQEAVDLARNFHSSDYFKHLLPFPDAIEVLPRLKENGWDFIAITAAGRDQKIIDNRKHNLEIHFPNIIDDVICVNMAESKSEELAKFDDAYWIDDSAKHVYSGLEQGHTCFHMSREDDTRQKIQHEKIHVVKNWLEVEKIINTEQSLDELQHLGQEFDSSKDST